MVEDGSFWDKVHRFLCSDYVVACVQVKQSLSHASWNIRDATEPIISGGIGRYPCFLEPVHVAYSTLLFYTYTFIPVKVNN